MARVTTNISTGNAIADGIIGAAGAMYPGGNPVFAKITITSLTRTVEELITDKDGEPYRQAMTAIERARAAVDLADLSMV